MSCLLLRAARGLALKRKAKTSPIRVCLRHDARGLPVFDGWLARWKRRSAEFPVVLRW
jgi:hypothetical protein